MQAPLRFGKYEVLGALARGGSGVVYRAKDPSTGRALALKTCSRHLRSERAALEREIAALERLTRRQRPGVVQLLDAGVEQGVPWYAMPLIAGQSLRDYSAQLWSAERTTSDAGNTVVDVTLVSTQAAAVALASAEPLPSRTVDPALRRLAAGRLSDVLELALALAESLHFIHEDGVVHGDLTLQNVVCQTEGRPVLVDFGTAFQLYEDSLMREIAQGASRWVGTPGYMAPEQIRAEAVEPRSDLYALGCVLYELLSGAAPFRSPTPAGLLRQHLTLSARPLRELVGDSVAPELEALVLGLLEKQPQRRPSRARDVMLALSRLLGRSLGSESTSVNAQAAALYRPSFVGRAAEMAELTRWLPARRGAGGGCVCLRGPSGAGKTRLLNELRAEATARACDVIAVSCKKAAHGPVEAAAGSVALGPALSQLAERALEGAPEDASLLEAFTVLAPYADGGLVDVGLPTRRNVATPSDVVRSLEVVVRACRDRAPLLLLIDDAQWADELTLQFVREKLATLSGDGLLVVLSYRSAEIDEGPTSLEAVANHSMLLGGVELPHVYALVRDMLAADSAPEGLPELLLEYSEGNPLLVGEYLRAAVGRGLVSRAPDGRWLMRDVTSLRGTIPDSLQGLFTLRLDQLSDSARAVLELAAILGTELDSEELALLAEGAPCAAALEELTRERILDYLGEGRYRFVHDKLRGLLESALGLERRRALHRRAARALEAVGSDEASMDRDARLGVHWAEAGEHAKALTYLRAAGASAQRLHGHVRAAALYRRALAQCDSLREAGVAVTDAACELHELLGDALLAQASHADARQAYERALELIPGAGERLARARNLRKIAASFWRAHAHVEARAKLELADAALGVPEAGDPTELYREHFEIQLGKFERLYFARDSSNAAQALLQSLEQPIALHAEAGQRVRYYLCAASDAMARCRYGSPEPALRFARQGTGVSAELLTRSEEALAYFIEGFALMLGDEGARREALRCFERAASGAQRAGDRTLSSRVAMYQALTLLRLGDVEGTRAASQRALELAEVAKIGAYSAAAHACAAWALWRRDSDVSLVRARAEQAQRFWRDNPVNYPFRWCLGFVLLELALRDEDVGAVAQGLEQLLDPTQQQLPPPLEAALSRGLKAITEGLYAEATVAASEALRLAQRFGFC